MPEITPDRRALLGAGAVLAAAMSGGPAGAAPPRPQPRPLGFDPTAVPGLSEKLLRSHYDNNYTGAVNRLGAISAELAGFDPASAPGYRLNGLKREELIAWNSMVLHEVYFAGFGSPERPAQARARPSSATSAVTTAGPASSRRWARPWAAGRAGSC